MTATEFHAIPAPRCAAVACDLLPDGTISYSPYGAYVPHDVAANLERHLRITESKLKDLEQLLHCK